MFGTKKVVVDEELEGQKARLQDDIQELTAQIKALRKERGDLQTRDELQAQIERLNRDLTQKQIDFDREKEKWDREKREVEHEVGLQRRRAAWEKESAIKDAELALREANLEAERAEFTRQLEFNKQQMGQVSDFLKENFKEVLGRLPDVTVSLDGAVKNSGAKK
jgi:chromosome segregation ATPase